MAHIRKPINEKAENNSFGGTAIVAHEHSLIDKMKTEQGKVDFHRAQGRLLLQVTTSRARYESGNPLVLGCYFTTSQEPPPFQEQVGFSAVRTS